MNSDHPAYGASPWEAIRLFWRRYLTFTGRASRSEFWWWTLVAAVVAVVLEIVRFVEVGGGVAAWWADYSSGELGGSSLPGTVWTIVTVLPTIALTARRLHDTNRSGWWQLIGFVPIVGWVVLLVWCVRGPDPSGRRYDLVTSTVESNGVDGSVVRPSE